MSGAAETKRPFWSKCGDCSHCWPAAYAPMEASLFAKIALNASKNCPKCGSKRTFVAKQHDGELLEYLP